MQTQMFSVSGGPEVNGDQLSENFWLGPMIHLDWAVGSKPARIDGDLGSIPGSGENFLIVLQINNII